MKVAAAGSTVATKCRFNRPTVLVQDGAKAYMRNHNVPKEMQQRVQRWYDYAWSRSVSAY